MKTIGTFTDEKGKEKPLRISVENLIKTRLLVTANSGGGKSVLLRVLLEQVGESTPIIVLDREGEYVTLGEKLDVVQVGPLGEIAAEVRSAGMLCRRLMEKRLSAVVDMSELPIKEQREYVNLFLEELVALPKKLWRPTIIALDEAHLFAPEKGHGEAESLDAVINASTLGRKRGYCTILATQRISKLHKDAAADQLNRFFGRTTLDVDIARSAKDIGLIEKDARSILRKLAPGEFFCFGPAFSTDDVVRAKIAKPQTTHPEPGQGRTLKPPKPSRAIKTVLKEFADLPQEAEQQIKDLAAAQQKIAELERDRIRRAKDAPASTAVATNVTSSREDQRTIARLRAGLEEMMRVVETVKAKKPAGMSIDDRILRSAIEVAVKTVVKAHDSHIAGERREWNNAVRDMDRALSRARQAVGSASDNGHSSRVVQSPAPAATAKAPSRRMMASKPRGLKVVDAEPSAAQPKSGAKKIAIALAQWHPKRLDRDTLRFYSGFSSGSGTFTDYMSQMRKNGMLDEQNDGIGATQATFDWLEGTEITARPTTPAEYLDNAMKMPFVKGGAKPIGKFLIDHRKRVIPRDELREQSGFAEGSGTFTDYLSQMRRAGIAVDVNGGVQANPAMFES